MSNDAKGHEGGPDTAPGAAHGRRVRWARLAYAVLACAFVACVGIQVFLAGLAIFAGPEWWATHTQFVHAFELIPLAMLGLAFVGRLSRGVRWLTATAVLLLALQYALIEVGRDLGAPALAALHPVNALLVFWVAGALARQAVRSLA